MTYFVNWLVISFFVVQQSVARPISIGLGDFLAITHWQIVSLFSFVGPFTTLGWFAKRLDVGGIDLRVRVKQVARLKQVLAVMVLWILIRSRECIYWRELSALVKKLIGSVWLIARNVILTQAEFSTTQQLRLKLRPKFARVGCSQLIFSIHWDSLSCIFNLAKMSIGEKLVSLRDPGLTVGRLFAPFARAFAAALWRRLSQTGTVVAAYGASKVACATGR